MQSRVSKTMVTTVRKKHLKLAAVTVVVLVVIYQLLPRNHVRRSETWQPMASFRIAASDDVIAGLVDFSQQNVQDGVPRIIHQTWRARQLPEMLQPWLESWVRVNPNWEYWFWTDDDLHSFIAVKYPEFLALFEGYPTNGYRADVFRYVPHFIANIIRSM